MSNYLFIDLGSTFTKLTLIDFDKLTIVGRASSPTTVETDVTTGFHNALKLLRKNIGEVVNYEKAYACSSAAGGLKMAAIGLVTELTTEAAKRVCLGSGAKVELVFSGILTDSDVKKLKENDIDIILLAGGIDGGDKKTVIENSKILARLNLNVPIVYAGNNKAIDEVGNILSNNKIEFYIAENVMPKLNKLNVLSAKNLIQKIFIEKIVDSKGIGNLSKYLDAPIIPTPVSVINVASLLSNMDEPVVIVDIGGATTDIYSVGYGHPKRPDTALIGLEEPLLKRTVEGDLGMRYSIKGLLSNLSEYDKDLLNNKFDLTLEIDKRNDNVFYLPENKNDSLIEEHFASLCASIAFSRHVGTIEEAYTHGGLVYYQTGKDLTDTRYLIGTGGVIVNNSNNKEILKSVLTRKDKPHELRPVNPKILIDKGYLLSAIGLLSQVDKKKALELLKKEILKKEQIKW